MTFRPRGLRGAGGIAGIAGIVDYPYIGHRASKSGVNTMTERVAAQNAEYGIRANAIMPWA